MNQQILFSRFLIVVLAFGLMAVTTSRGVCSVYNFKELQEKECGAVDPYLVMKLPKSFAKYANWAKACPLRKEDNSKAHIYIISIWSESYYESQVGDAKNILEHFPRPIIMDGKCTLLGELPELFPVNDTTFPRIYFGRWVSGIPTEIHVDVSNPAVDGDYFYPPIVWDGNQRKYFSTSGEVTHGQRRF